MTIANVDEARKAQTIVDQFSTFSQMAQRSFQEELRQRAVQREAEEKRRLEAELAELERKKEILANIKLK